MTAVMALHVLILLYVFQEIRSPPSFLVWKGALWIWSRLFPVKTAQCLARPYHVTHKPSNETFAIFQIYDRPLPPALDTWWGLSAALCAHYASRHGYHYQYLFVSGTDGFVHYGHRRRTLHWARIPIMRQILLKQSFNWFLYLDIDAMVNPTQLQYPLTWILSSAQTEPPCIIRGNSRPTPDLIFFSNAPGEQHMPCSGIFMSSQNSASSLDIWWQHPVHEYFDQNSEFDQHSLHEALYFYPQSVFKVLVMDIRGFDFHTDSSFFLHFSGQRDSGNRTINRHFYHTLRTRIFKALGPTGLHQLTTQPILQQSCWFDNSDEEIKPYCITVDEAQRQEIEKIHWSKAE